jgi:hypothetical protein
MSEAVNPILAEQALTVLRKSLPAGSYILLTPDDGMIVSPDPEDIKRSIDTLTRKGAV